MYQCVCVCLKARKGGKEERKKRKSDCCPVSLNHRVRSQTIKYKEEETAHGNFRVAWGVIEGKAPLIFNIELALH